MATILVVDDSAVDRRVAGGWVEHEGSTAIYAENGREALEVVWRDKPDVVLTDLQMPEMDGLELVKRMRVEHPGVPVMLMTAFGSEAVAAAALRAGAASYVPKKNLREELRGALQNVLVAVEAKQHREHVREFLHYSDAHFELGYAPAGPSALVNHLQDALIGVNFCDQTALYQVGTALSEALSNAVDHGNLELDSALREREDGAYEELRRERVTQPPYADRRVHVAAKLTPEEATYVIRDDGPGFDPLSLPDPRDPENLIKSSGRGIMLIRTFMDLVLFNDIGNEITMVKRRNP